ncbi:pentapeptide repeat-containing protein [Streptomyces europaeiscabiei]|uniref:pentapeptide repeat-containing protein n=1 Tax=Streptomyces europaeiscabiei TaxID=146819 RepID=UPI0029A6756A|nr:pentapeptide repeat-containing protein [Streptomyces europaeiscabiei]MDX3697897.1 pentapeptide repeat-containing protein [Streptomyces europaeiscabiei]
MRLWRVGWALGLAFAAAVLVAGGIFYGLVELLDFKEIDSTAKLDAKTLFDLVKLSFGVVAGAGALVALVVAYRRQRVDEAGAHREATRLHTERFSQAIDKLGSDSPAVRLGGVHALAGLADDAPDDNLRQTCIDVLCAYLRLPFPPDPGDLPDPLPNGTSPTNEQRDAHQDKMDMCRALREVRHTVLRLIGDHYRIPQGTHRSWQGCDLDLTGVTIDGSIDFRGATFSGSSVSFSRATFSGSSVSFHGATFSGSSVSFHGATFSGGEVSFDHATFSGSEVFFSRATFSGSSVSFGDATFSGGEVSFTNATFSDGWVSFHGATFSDGTVFFNYAGFSGGEVSFGYAAFSGGEVSFRNAAFSGGEVVFGGARFSGGEVSFGYAAFSGGQVVFGGATFSGGEVSFGSATFSGGQVIFGDATFSGGEVIFGGATVLGGATFSGGTVDFTSTTGPAPAGLLAAAGTPVPPEVRLRADWLPAGP